VTIECTISVHIPINNVFRYNKAESLPAFSTFMRFSLAGSALALASLAKPAFTGATYSLSDEIIGKGFYDKFNFEAIPDPSHGRVYVS